MIQNDKPLISIMIPYYNHNNFIKKALDSILEDTYPNKEIIIINDGSTEKDSSNLEQWIEEHKQIIPIIYKKRENKGITKTLNEIVKLSSGKYVSMLASDDYFINNTFSKRVEILENNEEKLMLISDAIVVDDYDKLLYDSAIFGLYGRKKQFKKNYFTDKGLKVEIIRRWSCVGPITLIDKKLFDIVGYYNEELFLEDWDFYLRVVAKDLMLYFDEKVAVYRWHDNNSIKDKKIKDILLMNMLKTQQINVKNFKFPYNLLLWVQVKKYLFTKKRRKVKKYLKSLLGINKNTVEIINDAK